MQINYTARIEPPWKQSPPISHKIITRIKPNYKDAATGAAEPQPAKNRNRKIFLKTLLTNEVNHTILQRVNYTLL